MIRRGYIEKLTEKVLRAADQQAKGNRTGLGGILLGGDPGVGKTTFIETFTDLVGIHLVLIEVPHIVEEHIINIPFLVYNPATGNSQTGNTQLRDHVTPRTGEYDMVLADSNLFTQISNGQNIPDQQYLARMNNPKETNAKFRVAQAMFKRLGGNETTIPESIQNIRESFRCLLFLDEYYRETPTRIRNILRDMLNGNIGIHKIPKGTFVMYASNMRDEGLSDIQKNQQMEEVEFRAPTQKEWFEYIETKFERDPHVQMKPEVLEAFKKVINDTNISHNDPESNVRSSPRRWEQLLIYVNQSLPVESQEDALALLTNVKNNFVNYETNEYSNISKEIIDAVTKLIKQNGIDVSETDILPGHDWDKALRHHIKQHMKSGNHRKYIPVVSGAPGVGKTQQISKIVREYNLVLVAIDTAKLNAEDVIGMPIPGERSEDNKRIKVKFTVPQLHQIIMREIEDDTETYFNAIAEKKGIEAAKAHLAKWEQQDWKYLIFFDELNRAHKKTFNALRRVILEKNFGPESDGKGGMLKLPDGSIVVGAINPSPDTGGTESMTGHFRDVIDVINAEPSWSKTRSFILNQSNTGLSSEAIEATMLIIDTFVKKFKSKREGISDDIAPYHLHAGNSEMYVSPREYTLLFNILASSLDSARKTIFRSEDASEEEGVELISEEIADGLGDGLRFPTRKAGDVAVEEFISLIQKWGITLSKAVHKILISKQVQHSKSWKGVLEPYLTGKRSVTTMNNDSGINTMMNNTNIAQFVEDISSTLSAMINNKEQIKKIILDDTIPRVALSGDTIVEDQSEHTHILGNVIMGLLFTLQLHGYQYDRIFAIGKALYYGSKSIMKEKSLNEKDNEKVRDALLDLRNDIHDALQEIKNETQ